MLHRQITASTPLPIFILLPLALSVRMPIFGRKTSIPKTARSASPEDAGLPHPRKTLYINENSYLIMAHKILSFHGFFASGACIPALALKEYFKGKATVLAPDLPLHPQEAIDFAQKVCDQEHPDLLVGNSNGSFLAQVVASKNRIPALLGNPHFEMTSFLAERMGAHEYKSPRANGKQELVIDQALTDEFAELQRHQWDYCQEANREKVWGLFGENDHLAHFEPLFLTHYKYSYHFPGGHTPTAEEVKTYYAPLAERLLEL